MDDNLNAAIARLADFRASWESGAQDDPGQAGALQRVNPDALSAGEDVVRDYRSISDDRELAWRVYTAMSARLEQPKSSKLTTDDLDLILAQLSWPEGEPQGGAENAAGAQ